GRSKSPAQTAPQEMAFICTGESPKLAVPALLELARWCQARREVPSGDQACTTAPCGSPPPALEHTSAADPLFPLGGSVGPAASASPADPQSVAGSSSPRPRSRCHGGQL